MSDEQFPKEPTPSPRPEPDSPVDIQAEFARARELHGRGELEEAERSYRAILAAAPRHFGAAHLLGVTFLERGQFAEAERQIELAIELNPNVAAAHNNRGNALQGLGRVQDAVASYDRAIALKPDYIEAFNNRGIALKRLERLEDAVASYNKAIALKPDDAGALNNRGIALRHLRRYDEALSSFERAIAFKPGHAESFNNRGNVFRDIKRMDEALASYDRAIALKPLYADALMNRGGALAELKRFDKAFADYDKALTIDATLPCVEGRRLQAKMQFCDWPNLADDRVRLRTHLVEDRIVVEPFMILAVSDSPAEHLQCAKTYAATRYPTVSPPLWRGERYAHRPIRLAYVSGEFREQATAHLIADLIECHDRSAFTLYGVSSGINDFSPMRRRLETAFDVFWDISRKSDAEAAELIHSNEIDILVNLNGYFGIERTGVFGLKPSPIQVNYLGFPGTMGVSFMDYIIADDVVIPEEHRPHFSESVVCLPDTYQPNDRKRRIGERNFTRRECGLPEDGIVFCCFNNSYKLTPEMFDVWMRLLAGVPGSVLWLLEGNSIVKRYLHSEAEKRGVARERIVFAPILPQEDYLARLRRADLFLDTLPCNAHTTASDSLWAGVPLLTLLGSSFAGRVAASLLHAIGMPELIAMSWDEYEAVALKLARDPATLHGIRTKLARNRDSYPLFDTPRYTRHLEAAYRTMWERFQRGDPPAPFRVERVSM
jgi:predicted O-linked N-acetylglucosamine transferase (SPINDLY family)